MKAAHRKVIQARHAAGERTWSSPDEAENALFDACCEVLEAAQHFERQSRIPASAGAAMAVSGCLAAALEALAGSTGSMREVVMATETIRPPERRKAVALRLEETRAALRRAANACGPEGRLRGLTGSAAQEDVWRL
jgi:hypothetical protein